MRGRTGANAGMVLAPVHISAPVHLVLDRPMEANRLQQCLRGQRGGVTATQSHDGFVSHLSRVEDGCFALQPKHLTNVGEFREIIEGGATADAPMFQTSVTFFPRVDRRGKNPRVRAPEGLLPRWVDCLWQ